MPLDPSYIGHRFPPAPSYRVGREKIREFADAIGATEAVYHDVAAAQAFGYPDVVAPPTFAIVITASATEALIADPGLGLDFSRVVHGDQKFAYTRPIHAGDELTCTATILEITERGGHGFLTTQMDITAADGTSVVAAINKLVVRGEG